MKTKWPLALALCGATQSALAAGYGIYDPRALAMGGAAVAVGNTEQGFYYNPALMAFHATSKTKGHDSRFYFPTLVGQVSDGAMDALQVSDDKLDQRLTRAIDAFNAADFSAVSAREAADAATAITDAIDKLDGRNLAADAYAGLAIAIPSADQGGSFFFGSRVVGGGKTDIKPADRELLEKYKSFLKYVADNDTILGAPTNGIFDANTGGLIDPTLNNTITSSAIFRGAALTEVGVSGGGLLSLNKVDLALGITPKVVQATLVDEERRVVNDGIQASSATENHMYVNLDLGAAVDIAEHYRVGFGAKDIISKHFVTRSKGHRIDLAPRYRLGSAYLQDDYSLGLDIDLRPSESFAGELTRQDLALGGEYRVSRQLSLRGGYRYDTSGNVDGGFNLGLGLHIWGLVADFAYASDGDGQSAGLQLGVSF